MSGYFLVPLYFNWTDVGILLVVALEGVLGGISSGSRGVLGEKGEGEVVEVKRD